MTAKNCHRHANPATRETPARRAQALHILVVEDEVEAAHAMADFLEAEGFEVSIAHDGRAGLEAYHRLHPDIIVTDIRMPAMDGAGLIRALRAQRADLPIIAVTGHMADNERIDAGAGAAPVTILRKPISLMELYHRIGKFHTA